jgi:hypothetical protein
MEARKPFIHSMTTPLFLYRDDLVGAFENFERLVSWNISVIVVSQPSRGCFSLLAFKHAYITNAKADEIANVRDDLPGLLLCFVSGLRYECR